MHMCEGGVSGKCAWSRDEQPSGVDLHFANIKATTEVRAKVVSLHASISCKSYAPDPSWADADDGAWRYADVPVS